MLTKSSLEEVKRIVHVFMTEVESRKRTGVPLEPEAINNTLRQANLVMSEKLIRAWLDKHSSYLFWHKDIRHISTLSTHIVLPQIYLHEFLFLATNAINRLSYVTPRLT
eukprot:TRINITY_DN14327_c0_g1_i13.p1 TRINITY_DN14327_c0_g1~~TRINITY_DN14327_c0_g1_i13.p1  ORF type:complete len:109 (+),score=18.19 TRINITY_DN14327_c0_g1_i13:444-770(+)